MDEDLREALGEIKTSISSVSGKVDALDLRLTTHLIADSGAKAASAADVNGLGRRLNDHLEAHAEGRKWFLGLWGAALVGLGKALWDLLKK